MDLWWMWDKLWNLINAYRRSYDAALKQLIQIDNMWTQLKQIGYWSNGSLAYVKRDQITW